MHFCGGAPTKNRVGGGLRLEAATSDDGGLMNKVLCSLLSSMLLAVGLASAAESFDVVSSSSQVDKVVMANPGVPCIPPN